MTKTKPHSYKLRVYYEDTDAQGVVYYANYLKFIERARTEYLRSVGYEQETLLNRGLIFVVNGIQMSFRKPAKLDDSLEIRTTLIKLGKVSFHFDQEVFSEDNFLLCKGLVRCACLNSKSFKPSALPDKLLNGMRSIL
ncbi:MAG: tol-pal system-associated acyl-CoA thioesterase [Gammaproteobacteria bacterium]|nr:MAG: tol-pal system-associated acyl-CoA thioesterase [Gammaproteobacteria bacterium]|tara:strand:- start:895 stop:1308 length:414 start_codon:yes stop_codon:yes gene_type:complete